MSKIISFIKNIFARASKRELVIVIVFGLFISWFQIDRQNDIQDDSNQIDVETSIESVAQTEIPVPGDVVKVSKIIDGDTIEIETGDKVRYIGIDTPETNHKPPDCFAQVATEKNRELVEGKQVRLVKDVRDKDRYGRLLRYVYIGETFVNRELVALGYARAFPVPPDVAHEEEFLDLEDESRKASRGLWGACDSKSLNLWERTTPERAETAEYQSDSSSTEILEDAPECFCDENYYDCRDFKTQAEAQSLYDCCRAKTGRDVHLIDADTNGRACERLI
ncbi:MAG: thermonuclease family protein [Patescibacteria group bacterium]|nr:thermonuclease family protein [Patescibacteria group bacterium]